MGSPPKASLKGGRSRFVTRDVAFLFSVVGLEQGELLLSATCPRLPPTLDSDARVFLFLSAYINTRQRIPDSLSSRRQFSRCRFDVEWRISVTSR